MADLVLGLAKTTVQGTVTMARLAIEEEGKLKKSVQSDLLVISDEFEMMNAFLKDAKGHVTDNVTRTMVRQVRNTALDLEDCIETIVHLDSKPHWWRRMILPWCMPSAAPGKDLDAVVANVEQLKARVGAMAQRRLLYNSINDNTGRKPAEHRHAIATGAAKQSGQVDRLIMLINGKGGSVRGQASQGNNNDDAKEEEKDKNVGNNNDGKKEEEKHETAGNKNDDKKEEEKGGIEEPEGNETEEAGNEAKGKKDVDAILELKVILVLGTGSDLDMMFIKKAYDDSKICDNFKCRAWVKLVHPFNPIEFIRSLLSQFQKNACQEQGNTRKVLQAIVAPEDKLIEMFETQIGQKYLVVLEDVSTMVDWEAIKSYLPDNKDGSCIVVHTRQHGIALLCVGQQYPVSELEMSLADHSAARVIFKQGVAGKDSDVDTGNGEEIEYEDWKEENPIYGREEDLQWLSRSFNCSSVKVASVWGISGVGQSFLIEHFCRKVKEQDMKCRGNPYYPHIEFVWVNVSRPFNLRDVRKKLPMELLKPGPKGSENVKYIIVIDGLQSTDEWDSIRPVFESTTPQKSDTRTSIRDSSPEKERTRIRDNVGLIIIITNEESVAKYCATHKNSVRNIKSLEADHAIKLFDQVAENSINYWQNDEEIEEIRYRNEQTRNILLQKCGGFPNVICAVAESRRKFCNIKVKDNLVTKLEPNLQLTTPSLEGMFSWLLAYFGSCPDSLKPCIFYLTIFPVNHTIRRRRLVRRWIVEGYTWDNKQITAEETANEFFSRLVKLSMIQPPPRGQRYLPSSSIMPLCQVNGFLREYVLSRSVEENFVFELQGNCKNLQRDPGTDNYYIKRVDMECVVQHLAIDKSWDRDRNVFESIDFSRLRSLTVFGRWESFLISDKMGRLRVLDLEDVSAGLTNSDVEKMVKLLPRLKFLSLRGCRDITHLPSFLGNLKQLQTLDIRETSVINLPKSITKLEKLQYIRAGTAVILDNNDTACTFGSLPGVAAEAVNPSTSAMPMRRTRATLGSCMSKFSIHRRLNEGPHNGINMIRGIGKLSSLHTLGVVNISAAGGEDVVDELKNLTLLHKLGVYGINRKISEKFFSAISRLAHLESLCLQFQLNQDHEAAIRLSPLDKLRSLKLYGLADRLPTWIMLMCSPSQLPRLKKLDLQMRKLPQQQLDSIIVLQPRILRLRLAEFEDEEIRFGFSIPRSSSKGGWCFDFLKISSNSRLQAVRFASSVNVVVLKIQCSSVSSSLQFFGLPAMRRLKEVWLSESYNDALVKHLKKELQKNNTNDTKPILRLEGNTSST